MSPTLESQHQSHNEQIMYIGVFIRLVPPAAKHSNVFEHVPAAKHSNVFEHVPAAKHSNVFEHVPAAKHSNTNLNIVFSSSAISAYTLYGVVGACALGVFGALFGTTAAVGFFAIGFIGGTIIAATSVDYNSNVNHVSGNHSRGARRYSTNHNHAQTLAQERGRRTYSCNYR